MKTTIENTKASKVTVEFKKERVIKRCKPIFNITTGVCYASTVDAAEILGVTSGTITLAAQGKRKSLVNGYRLCYMSEMHLHVDEIGQTIGKYYEIAKSFYEEQAKKEARKKAIEKHELCKTNIEKLKEQLIKAEALLKETEIEINKFESESKVG